MARKTNQTRSQVGAIQQQMLIITHSQYLTEHQSLTNYVQKETGKGLSTNDFSATYKNKLDDLPTKHITNIYIDNEGYLCVTWNGEQDSK